ncbi:sulfatase-like hydrolase/transferase [Algoriphagus limi]|uniref:Sulfatase-like hydrolase/transferase n=1 Tax=Algoriphagus limi TaxID=2975273 RepID=A0ABT2G7T0_9BACT|nr:sulfatase-like hydrolase/transferase [Algoriphagus limi]MCS5491341.1 sulfatase-like hydrolase/transferase [Algoriphagus limi]
MKKLIPIVILISFLFSCKEESQTEIASSELPNIVFIFTDDLGYGDLGCFGATDILTPNIDRIADEGIKFTNFLSASPVCSPSRAGLLTGRMPQRMGINQVFFPESFTGMDPEEITFAEVLKGKGYQTAIVGKWHLGHREKFLPLNQGFDSYYGIPYSNDMESVVYMKDNEVDSIQVNQRYTTQTYTHKSLEFIDQAAGGPFLLYLAHNMPHVPIYASPAFEGTSQRGLYGDVIQEIDWSVGQILKKLEEKDLLENTLIVFSSDNGPWLVMEDHGGSAGPLREGKQFTFEGGVRVPTVAMWKGKIDPGQVYEDLATQMDWFPTFSKLVGAEIPQDRAIDGKDLSAVLFENGYREGDEFIYYMGADQRAYQKDGWKIKRPFRGFQGAPWMRGVPAHDTLLFNLRLDPGETNNLAKENPEKLAQMMRAMDLAVQQLGPLPPSLVVRGAQDNSHYEYLNQKRQKE